MPNDFSVNNNSSATGILANLSFVQNEISTSYSQLSSGNRINSAADDPAGYAISQQMTEQVGGLNQSTQNAQNGVSLIQTATGAMNQTEQILQTLNTLANEAANGTQNSNDLSNLQDEVNQLLQQINTTAADTQFNNINLVGTSAAANIAVGTSYAAGSYVSLNSSITLQIGANAGQTINFSLTDVSTAALGISSINLTNFLSGSSLQSSVVSSTINEIQSAITSLSASQATLGAVQDELNYTVSNLQNSSQNLQNAEATITNTNMAQAYTQFSQQQVVEQVGLAMLGQAQQQPAAILKLLS